MVHAEPIVWLKRPLSWQCGCGTHLRRDVERDKVALVHELGGVLEHVEGAHALDIAEAGLLQEGVQQVVVEAHL